jgi:hypothetical protein
MVVQSCSSLDEPEGARACYHTRGGWGSDTVSCCCVPIELRGYYQVVVSLSCEVLIIQERDEAFVLSQLRRRVT